jgi:hypothetical protein
MTAVQSFAPSVKNGLPLIALRPRYQPKRDLTVQPAGKKKKVGDTAWEARFNATYRRAECGNK